MCPGAVRNRAMHVVLNAESSAHECVHYDFNIKTFAEGHFCAKMSVEKPLYCLKGQLSQCDNQLQC